MLLSLVTDPCAKAGRAPRVLLVPALAGFPIGHITTRIWLRVTLKVTLEVRAGQGKMHHDPGTLGQF